MLHKKRLEQILLVLRKAPVPWSSTIATLAKTSINYDHSLSFKIKIEYDYVPIKLILKKYGYATIGVNNVSINYDIIFSVISICCYINKMFIF